MVLPANLYKPMTLMGVFSKQEVNVEFFAKFFPYSKTYETDEVAWDEEEGNSLLVTPYSHPLAQAELITERGFRTFKLNPACIKERRNFDPYHNVVRQPGQDLSKPISKRELALINLKNVLKSQKEFFVRRIEVMAKDLLKTGNLDILDDGEFTFTAALNDGAAYDVAVLTQPTDQNCAVSNGEGTIDGADVTNVSVVCTNSAGSWGAAVRIEEDDTGTNLLAHPVYDGGLFVGFWTYMVIRGKNREKGQWRVEHWVLDVSYEWHLMCTTYFMITSAPVVPLSPLLLDGDQ